MRRTKPSTQLDWQFTTQFSGVVQKAGYRLGVSVSRLSPKDDWTVFALQSKENGLAGVLNSHAHQVVGQYGDLQQALAAAQQYADRWQPIADLCDCTDIKPKRTRSKRGSTSLPDIDGLR
jgi:hypothetical protein